MPAYVLRELCMDSNADDWPRRLRLQAPLATLVSSWMRAFGCSGDVTGASPRRAPAWHLRSRARPSKDTVWKETYVGRSSGFGPDLARVQAPHARRSFLLPPTSTFIEAWSAHPAGTLSVRVITEGWWGAVMSEVGRADLEVRAEDTPSVCAARAAPGGTVRATVAVRSTGNVLKVASVVVDVEGGGAGGAEVRDVEWRGEAVTTSSAPSCVLVGKRVLLSWRGNGNDKVNVGEVAADAVASGGGGRLALDGVEVRASSAWFSACAPP